MKSGSWSSHQAALPPEARAGGEPDDDGPTEGERLQAAISDFMCRLANMLRSNGRGVSYLESTPGWLLMRLRQEVEELAYEMDYLPVIEPVAKDRIEKECLDVAAFAMMVWDRVKHAK